MTVQDQQAEFRRRLRWQCRRGLLELDLLFARFLEDRYPDLEPAAQCAFHELLKQPDQQILGWVQGQENPPNEFRNILRLITQ